MTRLPISTIIPSPWREQLVSLSGLASKRGRVGEFDSFISDMKAAIPRLFLSKEEERARLAKLEDASHA